MPTYDDRMTRNELDLAAVELGIDPEQYDTKADLIEALEAHTGGSETDDDPIAARFMDRCTVRGVPARDLTRSELERLSPSLRGEALRTTPGGYKLYERV